MVVTKNQIRPRRRRFHLTNADLLALDTTGFLNLTIPAPLNHALMIRAVQIQANIVQPFTNLDGSALLWLFDDVLFWYFDNSTGGTLQSLFAPLFGPLVIGDGGRNDLVDATPAVVAQTQTGWTDAATLAAFGGIGLVFDNNGAGDLTGGDPANFVDFYVDFEIVNLEVV